MGHLRIACKFVTLYKKSALAGLRNFGEDLASVFVISYLHGVDAQIIAVPALDARGGLHRRIAHIFSIREYYDSDFALNSF